MTNKILTVIFLAIALISNAYAQDNITSIDVKEIDYQANKTVTDLQTLLNFITFSENPTSYVRDAISNSYSETSRNRIFYNSKAIFENDLDPQSGLNTIGNVDVNKYLHDLDIKYKKTPTPSITFTNLVISDIKKKEYLYVRVKYTSAFGSKYKISNSVYPVRDREALLRIAKTGVSSWNALIVSVGFYNPANDIKSTEYDVPVFKIDSARAAQDSIRERKKRDSLIQIVIEKRRIDSLNRIDSLCRYNKDQANKYINAGQDSTAVNFLEKAKDYCKSDSLLIKKIADLKKKIFENSPGRLRSKGDKAMGEHRYEKAVQFYQRAVDQKPELSAILSPIIKQLNEDLSITSVPRSYLASGSLQAAINESDKLLKANKNRPSVLPELFYIEAVAYSQMSLYQPRAKDKAIENFSHAIESFPNYFDAHLARANFFIDHSDDIKNARYSAISDLEILIRDLPEEEDSRENLRYSVKKINLEVAESNIEGAISDYGKVIASNPKADTLYFGRGKLLYDQSRNSEAIPDFDKSIKLNPQYADAYYYRGLNFIELKDNYSAGQDFAKLDKLNIKPDQRKTIDSLSTIYFLKGEANFKSHNFLGADSAYIEALKIRACNSLALHARASIYFIKADTLKAQAKSDSAKKAYQKSIDFDRQAVTCSPDFSDAYLSEGLAHSKIKEFDLAIKCFEEAIRSNNINANAYIEKGRVLQIQGNYTGALECFKNTIPILSNELEDAKKGSDKRLVTSIKTNLSWTEQLAGVSWYNLKDYANALNSVNLAIQYNENNAEAFYYRGLVYEAEAQHGNIKAAIRDFAMAATITNDLKYYFEEGKANLSDKNYNSAIQSFTSVIDFSKDSLSDDDPSIRINSFYLRGISYFKNNMFADAINDFAAYAKPQTSISDADFYSYYGTAQLCNNQDQIAIENLKNALKLSPNHPLALFSLGCAYAKAGKNNESLQLIEQSFATHKIEEQDIKPEEELFLKGFNGDKTSSNKYNTLKKMYLK